MQLQMTECRSSYPDQRDGVGKSLKVKHEEKRIFCESMQQEHKHHRLYDKKGEGWKKGAGRVWSTEP